jgi:TAT (twin-arginine translocation) pathway signal sequence
VDKRSEGDLTGRESAMGVETTTQRPMMSRRQLFKYGAATGAAATVGTVMPAAHAHSHGLPRVLPAPRPIPGGFQIPDGPLLHVFAPGPEGVTLPFTGVPLEGLDAEPSVITDYKGFTAVAFHVGTATGSDGRQYNLETDLRAMEGTYIAEDGSRNRGLFALI